ncbi:MAG: Calcium/proton antiporter, partial [uncultured Sphingomonas sp.]
DRGCSRGHPRAGAPAAIPARAADQLERPPARARLAGAWRRGGGAVLAIAHRRRPDRRGARRCPPCGGGRAPGRRAVRDADPGAGGHGDRGGADRLPDAGQPRRRDHPGARHGVRHRHDHPQPAAGPLPGGRGCHPKAAGGALHPHGRHRRAQRPRHAAGADAGAAQLHDHASRTNLYVDAAGVRVGVPADPLLHLRVRADGRQPRLFPAPGRVAERARGPRAAAVQRAGGPLLPVPAGKPGRRGAAGQVAVAGAGGCRRIGRSAAGGGRHRHRRHRSSARKRRRSAGGTGQPPADQPQPRLRVGPGDDRPHHPRGGRHLLSPRPAAGARARSQVGAAAVPQPVRRGPVARARPGDRAARGGAPGDLRGLSCDHRPSL